eukprot:scaffold22928_cov60-Phaeocystis_antarctica.AAC.4
MHMHMHMHPLPRRRPSRRTRTTRSRARPPDDSRPRARRCPRRWPCHRVQRRRLETAARTRGSPSARRAAWARRPGTGGVDDRTAWDSE